MNQNSSAYSGIAHNLNKFLNTSLHNLAYTPVEKKKRKGEGKRVKHEKKNKQKNKKTKPLWQYPNPPFTFSLLYFNFFFLLWPVILILHHLKSSPFFRVHIKMFLLHENSHIYQTDQMIFLPGNIEEERVNLNSGIT